MDQNVQIKNLWKAIGDLAERVNKLDPDYKPKVSAAETEAAEEGAEDGGSDGSAGTGEAGG